MAVLQNKIDFALVIAVNHANPNGDPLNGNRPRETYEGLGEISDVCLKRKIRNRMMDLGQNVFVQSDDRCNDCALPGFVDSKNEEKTERNAGYLVVSQSGGGMLRQGTREGIRRTPANRGMRAHRIVKGLDISEDVCHGLCP